MSEVVLVGMSLQDVAWRAELGELAGHVAFLQLADPSLSSVLTRLADRRINDIVLVGFSRAGQPPARSWLGRVASHWLREYGGKRPAVHLATELLSSLDPVRLKEVAGRTRPVTDDAAGLSSPAWDRVPSFRHQVFVCRGPRCAARGAEDTAEALGRELMRHDLGDDDVLVTQTGCQFPCNHAPVLSVHPDNVWYGRVDAADVTRIVEQHLIDGTVVESSRLACGS